MVGLDYYEIDTTQTRTIITSTQEIHATGHQIHDLRSIIRIDHLNNVEST